MTIAYKIALGSALALLVLVTGYYVLQEDGERLQVLPSGDELAELVREDRPQVPATRSESGNRVTRSTPIAANETPRAEPAAAEDRQAAAPPVRSAGLNANDLRSRLAAAHQAAATSPAVTPPPLSASSERAVLTGPAPAAEPRQAPATAPSFDLAPGGGTAPVPAPAVTRPAVPVAPVETAVVSRPERDVAPPADGGTYVVQSGDTLERIAERLYGDRNRWQAIAQANPRVDPIKLRIGQELRLPEASELARRPDAVVPVQGEIAYVVRSGDTLSSIAKQFYGDPNAWRIIFNANQEQIGRNSNRIRAGMKLQIPAAPQPAR